MTSRHRQFRPGPIVAAALAGLLASPIVFAADPAPAAKSPADSKYQKERADCDAGRTAEDRATCLKEAGAAQVERKRNTLDNTGTPMMNATERCNVLPAKDKADCLARIVGPAGSNQKVTTSGSVAGGGMIKETTTTTPGSVTVLMPAPKPTPAPMPAGASASAPKN